MPRARATKPDILRATARQEARGAPNAAGRSRFVPSTQTVLRGAAAAAALAATAATVAAGIHALNKWTPSQTLTWEKDMPLLPRAATGQAPMSTGTGWFQDLFGFTDVNESADERKFKESHGKFVYEPSTGT